MSREQVERQRPPSLGDEDEGCHILHVDMDAFFASVELRHRPELQQRPVVIGSRDPRSVVVAANYPARTFGIHSAMPMGQALQRCPQAVVLPPHHEQYRELSDHIVATFHSLTGLVEQVSIDEAYLDVRGRPGSAREHAVWLRNHIHTTFELTCTVGVARNKLLAKLASTLAKPDGLYVVPRDREQEFLAHLPASRLPGVGPKTSEKLNSLGIRWVPELAQASPRFLTHVFGAHMARHMQQCARGEDERPVVPDRVEKSMSAEETMTSDLTEKSQWSPVISRLALAVSRRLERGGKVAQVIAIKVRTANFQTMTRQVSLQTPTRSRWIIAQQAMALLEEVVSGQARIRLLGIRAAHLEEESQYAEQLSLLVPHALEGENTAESQPDRRVTQLLEQAQEQYGADSLQPASSLQLSLENQVVQPARRASGATLRARKADAQGD